MICLFSMEDGEMLAAKTGNWFDRSPWRSNSNNSVAMIRGEVTKRQYNHVFKHTKEFGDPGFVFLPNRSVGYNPCSEAGLNPMLDITEKMLATIEAKRQAGAQIPKVKLGDSLSGVGFCVSGDTKILTSDGIANIRDAVGKDVEVWNGKKWAKCSPFATGSGRSLYRVSFNDGSYLDCTDNHKFLVKDRFMEDYTEVETKDLMSFSKYQIHAPRANVSHPGGLEKENAYTYGFVLGDGSQSGSTHTPRATLYTAEKRELPLDCVSGREWHQNGSLCVDVTFPNLGKELSYRIKYDKELPPDLFSWDRASTLEFVAGWMDADGSTAGTGARVYGAEGKIRSLQLLLTKAGLAASVNCMAKAGEVTNLGARKNGVWYVQIPDAREIPSHRIDVSKGSPSTCKGKFQIIKSVQELPGLHETFCLEEKEDHNCLFNNVITKQCNLCEIDASKFESAEDMVAAATMAARLGTLQATYTSMPFVGWVAEMVCEREALLGVGMTGMKDSPGFAMDPEYQTAAAKAAVAENQRVAKILGINEAARVTVVKPAGSSSLLLGGVGSGIHEHHARRYFRRVTANENEPVFQYFKSINPHMCVKKPSGDWVIEFLVEAPPGAALKEETSAIEFLKGVKLTQANWIKHGLALPESSPGLTHNVSNTVVVKPEEWAEVAEYVWSNQDSFGGVSFLPSTGDKDFAFAPMEAVTTEADEEKWNFYLKHYKPVDYSKMV